LFALFFFALALPASSQQPNAERRDNADSQGPGRGPDTVTTHFAPGHEVDSATYHIICHSPKDREHADLCQQWRVAEASENQVVLTVLGFLALLGTLFFTGLAAVAAKQAVKEARLATAEAKLQTDLAKESGRARVYVIIDEQEFNKVIESAAAYDHPTSSSQRISPSKCKYKLRNYGKAPAVLQRLAHRAIVAEDFPTSRDYSLQLPMPFEEILADGETTKGRAEVQIPAMTTGDAVAIKKIEKSIFLYGYLTYHDAFQRRTLYFAYIYNGMTNGSFQNILFREVEEPGDH
jgi:hypothetical protein